MKHLKGKENHVGDALSRKLHCIYEVLMSQVSSNILEIIKEVVSKDPEYNFLWLQTKEALLKKGKIIV